MVLKGEDYSFVDNSQTIKSVSGDYYEERGRFITFQFYGHCVISSDAHCSIAADYQIAIDQTKADSSEISALS